MTEVEFINSIDCRFPYGNAKKARVLVMRAMKISPNAVFMIYHELSRPPRGTRSSQKQRLAILECIDENFIHPLSGLASWLTRKSIAGEELSVARAAAAARVIAQFPGCYNVLNIAYFSCDDKLGNNERLFDAIPKQWEAT